MALGLGGSCRGEGHRPRDVRPARLRPLPAAAGAMPVDAGPAAPAAWLCRGSRHAGCRTGVVPGRRRGQAPAEPGGPRRGGRSPRQPGARPVQPGAERDPDAAGQPTVAVLGEELRLLLEHVAVAARAHGGRLALIGILPTLGDADLHPGVVSDVPRYRALNSGLQRLRNDPFDLRIAGAEPLELASDDVSLEGAATSFQVHLRVDPAAFARTYNAVQAATAPVLAVAGNSPTFLGHRLWEETRVALCKQSLDERDRRGLRRRLARVAFGTGWLRGGALELFAEGVRRRWRSFDCTRAPCGAGTGPSTTQPRVATCASRCGPCPPVPPWSTCSPTPPCLSGSRCGWPDRTNDGPTRCRLSAPSTVSTEPPSTAWPPSSASPLGT